MKSNPMAFTITGAVVLLLLVSLFPMTTSLGQGINEGIIVGWKGVYDPADHLYNLRFLYQDGSYEDGKMSPLPLEDFTNRTTQSLWTTGLNSLAAIKAGYAVDPKHVRYELGTSGNVASFANPFPGKPIAYTASFLQDLSRQQINPKQFGGPDIPPGSVPYGKLPNGLLQIDTQSNGNTIIQLQPGEVPPLLKVFK